MEWSRERCAKIETALAERHGTGDAVFGVTGETEATQIEVRFQLDERNGDFVERVVLEGRLSPGRDPEAAEDALLDALDATLSEYFEAGRRLVFEPVWRSRRFAGRAIEIRGERTCPELDAAADALLASDVGDGLPEPGVEEQDDHRAEDR